MAKIPIAHSGVRLNELHPRMKYRLEHFFADDRINGKVVVSSGVRTYAQQKELYRRYKAGTFPNLVANPDRIFGGGFQGSWHMQQPNHPEGSYGFAVDFRNVGGMATHAINKIAAEYGLYRTVPSEWWHHQGYGYRSDTKAYGWFPAPALKEGAEIRGAENRKPQNVFEALNVSMQTVLRKGNKGTAVELLQSRLANKGYRLSRNPTQNTGIDGHFGGYTLRALKQFQKKNGLTVDGICGPNTWKVLMK